MPRKILHLDLDAFFCAVEELRNPQLVGKPFAVGGLPQQRGVVASCSYAARSFGVRSAMPMSKALRLCPSLIVVSSRHGEYARLSDSVMEHLRRITPLVEQVSIDEAFLDVTDLPESAEAIARRLQSEINQQFRLPCSLGAASNKLVAKIATDVGKSSASGKEPPNAITVVPAGEERDFLAPLPVIALWGIGPKTAARLNALGVTTIGELASVPVTELMRLFGKPGLEMHEHALGIDNRPIVTTHPVKSISQEITFAQDTASADALKQTLHRLAEAVGRRLRQAHLAGSTVKVKIRWPDFTTLTRQVTLEQPTDQDAVIFQTAYQLFLREWSGKKAVRLIGVGVSKLRPPTRQLSLWDTDVERTARLQHAIDTLRARFGSDVIRRYQTHKNHQG